MALMNLIEKVREALAACQPCRAKEITSFLRRGYGHHVDVRAVLELLYGPLQSEVERNSDYEWCFRQDRPGEHQARYSQMLAGGQACAGDLITSHGRNEESVRARLLRTLQRLRSGLPPTEGLEHLSVGYGQVLATIEHRLNGHEGSGRWIMARGNYGAGKTHFLQTVRDLAHARGFATCYLCADSGMSALNHPQRFMASLLGSLEIPGRASLGYSPLILQMAATPEGRKVLLEQCRKWSIGGRMPFSRAMGWLWTLESIDAAKNGADVCYAPQVAGLLADDLSGLSIAHRAATPDARQLAYHLLLMARDLLRHSGYRGLVILLDEVESIYTKLPGYPSRRGAVKVLAAFCESGLFKGVMTAVAITPDAHRMLVYEMAGTNFDDCLGPFEPVDSLLRRCADGSPHLMNCHVIRGAEVAALLEKVRGLYLAAYPGWSQNSSQEKNWARFVGRARPPELPNRLLVRHAVDLLDAQRYGSA
jgi:hypothetical protein